MTGTLNRAELDRIVVGNVCRLFADYWWELRDGLDGVPNRRDFDPSRVKPALPLILLHDLGTPGKSMLRLIGTGIAERYGFDATGTDYLEYVSPERRDIALRELLKTATHPCAMRVVVECRYISGKTTVGESLGFPFSGRDGQPMMMFCDQLLEQPGVDLNQREQPLEIHTIRERDYIDIGFGCPLAED